LRCCLHQLDALARHTVAGRASDGREAEGTNRESSKAGEWRNVNCL
jgi:hypothetical protein